MICVRKLTRNEGASSCPPPAPTSSRSKRVTSALIGASSVAQLEANVAALENLGFTNGELEEIDRYATDSSVNIWARSSAL